MAEMMDMEKVRREKIRWLILVAVNSGRPYPVAEGLLQSAIESAEEVPCTAHELRRELDYLATRELVDLKRREGAPWSAELKRKGVDVIEYTIECEAGIARPKKYW
jgi:hypothetical protein